MEIVKVKKDLCVGCGACVNTCSKYFEFDDDGLSKVKKEQLDSEDKKEVLEAIETCIQYETDTEKLNMLYARKKNLEELLNIE